MKVHFRDLKPHARMSVILVGGLLVGIVATQAYQSWTGMVHIGDLAESNQRSIEELAAKDMMNVFRSVQYSVVSNLERGALDDKLLAAQKDVQGLLEFSVFDMEGEATHSSEPKAVGRKLPEDLKAGLLSKADMVSRETAGASEIYQPLEVRKECLRCHDDWKEGSVAGVTFFRFSNEALAGIRRANGEKIASARTANLRDAVISAAVMVAIVVVLTLWTMRSLIASLLGVAAEISRGSRGMKEVAEEFSSSCGELAEGARKQAADLKEAVSSLGKVSELSRSNAERAEEVRRKAGEASGDADRGGEAVKGMTEAISLIQSTAKESAKIIKTIEEIALQTNLLSLNAAIEAAHAGDAGAGFAVVAGEVRNLAGRSAQAAKSTAQLIAEVHRSAAAGVQAAREVSDRFGGIRTGIGEVASLISGIAESSSKQTEAVDGITGTVREIDAVAGRNASASMRSAGSAENLKAQVDDLDSMVARIVAVLGGDGAREAGAGEASGEAVPSPVAAARREPEAASGEGPADPVEEPFPGLQDEVQAALDDAFQEGETEKVS